MTAKTEMTEMTEKMTTMDTSTKRTEGALDDPEPRSRTTLAGSTGSADVPPPETGTGTTSGEAENPDDVLLNPAYARKLKEASAEEDGKDPLDVRLARPLTDEELASFGNIRKKRRGVTLSPAFRVANLGRKNKKPFLIPFVGIEGTF